MSRVWLIPVRFTTDDDAGYSFPDLLGVSWNSGAAAGCGDAQWIHKTSLLGQLLAVSYRGGDDLRLCPIADPSSWLQIR